MEQTYTSLVDGPIEKVETWREWSPGEVCVKVRSVPINPIDCFKINASDEERGGLPSTSGIGFDAIGEIVDSNVDNNDTYKNKLVAVYQTFFSPNFSGTWRQYIYCPVSDVYILPEDSQIDKFWHFVGNPLAACGLYETARKYNAEAVIQDVSCSAVGKMFYRYATHKGMKVINIVRSEKQEETLKELGAEYIINSTHENFLETLKKIVDNLKPTVFLDAIGNEMVSKILRLMPNGSTAVIYGTLAPSDLGLTSMDVLFGAKTITQFGCPFWLKTLKPEEIKKIVNEIIQDFKEGGRIFGHPIHHIYPYHEYRSALEDYPKTSSLGKILINMNP